VGWLNRYARGNFRALAEAVVPETPDLAERLGEEHRVGAAGVGMGEYLVDTFNHFQEMHLGTLGSVLERFGLELDHVPAAPLMALLLDVVSLELCLRGRCRHPVEASWTSPRLGGLFRDLHPRDRLRVLSLLEHDSLLKRSLDAIRGYLPGVGVLEFMATAMGAFPVLTYYSDWSRLDPDAYGLEEGADGDGVPIGWRQADYPGPAPGYADFRGYEVEAFEENDYR